MRKILIATPIKLGLTSTYMAGFVPTIQTKFPGVQLEHCVLEGPSVNFARNEIAHYALKIGARELVFVDDDMGFSLDHFRRLISHVDVDIVAALYCKRRPGQPFWLMNSKDGAEIDERTGLCEVEDIATGFMKIRVDTVLPAIMKNFPELEFYNKPEDGKPVTAFEFFPMGVWGPRTPRARLEAVAALIANEHHADNFYFKNGDRGISVTAVKEILTSKKEPGNLRGEDYGFCELARRCGFKIYADFGAPIVPHIGKIAFPILPEMVGLDPAAALAKADKNS